MPNPYHGTCLRMSGMIRCTSGPIVASAMVFVAAARRWSTQLDLSPSRCFPNINGIPMPSHQRMGRIDHWMVLDGWWFMPDEKPCIDHCAKLSPQSTCSRAACAAKVLIELLSITVVVVDATRNLIGSRLFWFVVIGHVHHDYHWLLMLCLIHVWTFGIFHFLVSFADQIAIGPPDLAVFVWFLPVGRPAGTSPGL